VAGPVRRIKLISEEPGSRQTLEITPNKVKFQSGLKWGVICHKSKTKQDVPTLRSGTRYHKSKGEIYLIEVGTTEIVEP
jgi:hypothetical protein